MQSSMTEQLQSGRSLVIILSSVHVNQTPAITRKIIIFVDCAQHNTVATIISCLPGNLN